MSEKMPELIELPGMAGACCLIAASHEDLLAAWTRWRRSEEMVQAMVPISAEEANKRLVMITGIA